MNCKYNSAYDVQRLNTQSKQGVSAGGGDTSAARQERFEFARDNPDLVAYMLTLRTELLMRIVMPAVVGRCANPTCKAPDGRLLRYLDGTVCSFGPCQAFAATQVAARKAKAVDLDAWSIFSPSISKGEQG